MTLCPFVEMLWFICRATGGTVHTLNTLINTTTTNDTKSTIHVWPGSQSHTVIVLSLLAITNLSLPLEPL